MNKNTKEKSGTSQEDVKGQMSIDDFIEITGDDSADAGGEGAGERYILYGIPVEIMIE